MKRKSNQEKPTEPLKPAEYTESGYRLYDDTALERLQQILLFRELEFPLKDIKDKVALAEKAFGL